MSSLRFFLRLRRKYQRHIFFELFELPIEILFNSIKHILQTHLSIIYQYVSVLILIR